MDNIMQKSDLKALVEEIYANLMQRIDAQDSVNKEQVVDYLKDAVDIVNSIDDKDIDSELDKEGEWEDNEGYNKEDKNWWWKKKKGYDKDDCDDVYPEKDYGKENQLKDSDQ